MSEEMQEGSDGSVSKQDIPSVPEGQPEHYEQKSIHYPRTEHVVGHTIIRGEVREVWDRRVAHKDGQWNNCGPTYWVKLHSKGDVVGKGDYARTVEEDEWAPWLLNHGSFNVTDCWSYNVEEGHSTRYKWDELRINHYITASIYLNKRKVYQTQHHNHLELMLRMHGIMKGLQALCVNVYTIEDELPRAMYYKDQAVVAVSYSDDGELWFETPNGLPTKTPKTLSPEECDFPYSPQARFCVDILSEELDWFRKTRVPGDEKWDLCN